MATSAESQASASSEAEPLYLTPPLHIQQKLRHMQIRRKQPLENDASSNKGKIRHVCLSRTIVSKGPVYGSLPDCLASGASIESQSLILALSQQTPLVLWSFVFSVRCKRSVLVLNFAVVFLLHTLLHPDSKCARDFAAYAHSFPGPLVTCNHLDQRVRSEPTAH